MRNTFLLKNIKMNKTLFIVETPKRSGLCRWPRSVIQQPKGHSKLPSINSEIDLSCCDNISFQRNHPFVAAKIEMIRTKGGMSCTSDKSYETSDGNHRNRASRIKFLSPITSHFATFSNASHIYKWRHIKAFGLSTGKLYVPRSVLVSVLGVSTPWLKSAFLARSGRSKIIPA